MASCPPGAPWCPAPVMPDYKVTSPPTHPDQARRAVSPVKRPGTPQFAWSPLTPYIQTGGVTPPTQPLSIATPPRLQAAPPVVRPTVVAPPPTIQSPKTQRVDVVVRTEAAPYRPMPPNGTAYQPPAVSKDPTVSLAAAAGIGRVLTMKCMLYAAGGAFLAYVIKEK